MQADPSLPIDIPFAVPGSFLVNHLDRPGKFDLLVGAHPT